MKWMAILISFCILMHEVNCAGFVFPLKTKVIGKFSQWICSWLSQAQYVQIIDQIEPQLNENTEIGDMKTMLISAAMSATSLSQKLAIAGIGTKFMTKATLDVPIGILATALGNNLAAFVNQMVEMYVNYQDAGKTRERIFQRGYKMIDMFMTQKRVSTIYCRIKKAFDAKDATWWPFITSNLGAQIKFSTLDGLGTCV
uniref:Uncharacterized protein n=1 Tax=Panagrolaimus davidi TaxID=227884 RepID=A0A914QCQ8_9BILA